MPPSISRCASLIGPGMAHYPGPGTGDPLARGWVAARADSRRRGGGGVGAFARVITAPSAPAEDQALLAVARRGNAQRRGSLVFASLAMPEAKSGAYTLLPPFSPELAALSGFANAPLGADGVVRRFTPILPGAGGARLPALSLAALAGSRGPAPRDPAPPL